MCSISFFRDQLEPASTSRNPNQAKSHGIRFDSLSAYGSISRFGIPDGSARRHFLSASNEWSGQAAPRKIKIST